MTARTRKPAPAHLPDHEPAMHEPPMHSMPMMSWGKFAAMIAVSTAVMFPLMYQLIFSIDHATFSLTRLVSALVMGCVMAAIMLAFMWNMYRGQGTKMAVLAGSIIVGLLLLMVNRNQSLIGDSDFMKSMIPHHSIAINNARKADIRDPRVRELADQIIKSQVKEIAEMNMLVADIDKNGLRNNTRLPAVPATMTPQMEAEAQAAVE